MDTDSFTGRIYQPFKEEILTVLPKSFQEAQEVRIYSDFL